VNPPELELDPLRVAGGGAILGGVASLVQPFFLGLAIAGAALAGVAWLPSARRDRPGFAGATAIAGSWVFYLLSPPAFRPVAGVALGIGALLLVVLAHPDRSPGAGGG
jgi:hypothetical protein